MTTHSKSALNTCILITLVAMLAGVLPISSVQASSLSQGEIASGVTFTVNSLLDQPDTLTIPGTCHTIANTCTLRAAIMQANRTSGAGATIILPAGLYQLTIPSVGLDDETVGDLNIIRPAAGSPTITITGAGAGKSIIDANQLDRILSVASGRITSISGVTFRNGFSLGTFSGGAILNLGAMTLNNVTVSGNHSSYGGGGVQNEGTINIQNSAIIQNTAVRRGGGMTNFGTATITNSTLSQNTAGTNGGGFTNSGTASLIGSTIDGNTADLGGGISNAGSLFLISDTISQNNAIESGGGFYNFTGQVNVYNTSIVFNQADSDANFVGAAGGVFNAAIDAAVFNIRTSMVAGNYDSGTPTYDDCAGIIHVYGNNLFWNVTGCSIDITTGSWSALNSLNLIGTLQNNGGPTRTHALLAGSNAINAADISLGCVGPDLLQLPKDQRGAARVAGPSCDIGSYEYYPILNFKSTSSLDGWTLETSELGNMGGSFNSAATTLFVGDNAQKKQYRSILSFNTGITLPDNAVITKVTLKIQQKAVVGGGSPVSMFQGFLLDVRKGSFGTMVLQASDFQTPASKTFGPVLAAPAGGWYSINLTSAKSYINTLSTLTGQTQIRLRFKLDDNNNAVANYLSLHSGNAPLVNRPQLIVEYYLP